MDFPDAYNILFNFHVFMKTNWVTFRVWDEEKLLFVIAVTIESTITLTAAAKVSESTVVYHHHHHHHLVL